MDKNTKSALVELNQKIKELNSIYRMAAAKSGISDGEAYVWLTLLDTEEVYSQQDLCEFLSLPKQTVNSIISRLIKQGFVTLEHAKGTRNRKVIRITEAGEVYGKEKVSWIYEAEQKVLEKSSFEQVRMCIEMIDKHCSLLRKELGVE